MLSSPSVAGDRKACGLEDNGYVVLLRIALLTDGKRHYKNYAGG